MSAVLPIRSAPLTDFEVEAVSSDPYKLNGTPSANHSAKIKREVIPDPSEEIIGESPALRGALKQAGLVAPTDSTVLIEGESGTGKEVIAGFIHSFSPRRHNDIIKINCAAIPSGLLESELFGHERGAFTGAIKNHVGRFQLAHKGTLLLDEIGDLPFELQPKLLRVLQDQEFERLGSGKTLKTDVRVIAATHRNLAQMVEDGKFREDLYYRLNVFPLTAPPLRDRGQDILLLARHFAQRSAARIGKRFEDFAPHICRTLLSYDWPGNIRELHNIIERAVILSENGIIRPQIPAQARLPPPSSGSATTLREVERRHILKVLSETNWVISGRSGAAVKLGLNRTTLAYRMRKLGITRSNPQYVHLSTALKSK
jgi:formate hydrogenlyase transcriptional activator